MDLDLAQALSRLRRRAGLVLLDSAGGSPRRASVLGFDPLPASPPQELVGLRDFVGRLEVHDPGDLPPFFGGGFLGALAYDLGVVGEPDLRLPRDPWGFPRVVGGLYVDFIVQDHGTGESWLCLAEDPGDGRPPRVERRRSILDALGGEDPAREPEPLGPLERRVPREVHCDRIVRAREEIAAGEIYQANLAHPFTRVVRGHPIDVYRALRREQPAPYMGFAAWEGGALLSASPELLLEFAQDERGPYARTRPIKGTARRAEDPEQDRRSAEALLASEKDLAELAMIVDLERNDLGRIARAGEVWVTSFPELESYRSVHHLVADVWARPRTGVDAVEVLASLFPGGSITGAPKLRSMEVIAELEGEGRGFSFGSLGGLDTRGTAAFNLLIRTLLWRPRPDFGERAGEYLYRVGGGITWGSDPLLEDQESLDKGQPLARALAPESGFTASP